VVSRKAKEHQKTELPPGKRSLYHKYLKKSNYVNMELAHETIEKYASQYF
jgi:hypothetical protein